MRKSAIFLVALTLSSAPLLSAVYAQSGAQNASDPIIAQKSPSSGTAPEHMGSSGWTGGSTGAGTGAASTTTARENINQDSVYATGENLEGPAAHFRPSSTPE